MLPTVHIMMFGWPIVSLLLFFCCRPRSAVLISLLSGWLLLPQFSFLLPGIPNYTRTAAVVLGILLGVIIFDPGQLAQIRLRFFDIPIIALCMCPMASSLSNGLGIYDGISAAYTNTINYGIPYIIGRTYFSEPKSMREFAKGLVIAVLCYTPLILYEYRMSPQLHKIIYGFMQTHFHMVLRLGWYRPMVFLRHGLELGTLVSGATLTAFWLRRTRSVARYGWLSAGSAALFLFVILLLCRALNGYVTFIIGIIVLFAISILKIRTVAFLLVLLPMIYIQGRIVMDWDAAPLIGAAELINVSRARSLESRVCHESALIDKALRRP
ncbi:hypothetical protein, partial [Desulfopila inferna]|uniref:hypothetical protein n=1 Tax=Desulfopila inferna TaxID=468528 RepID=UPI001965F46B